MENQNGIIFLGVKVKPGPVQRFKLENFGLDNTISILKNQAEQKTNVPSSSLEVIHHGKILKDNATLVESGVKHGEMVHIVKKRVPPAAAPPQPYSDTDLQMLNASLRTLGCTPNAPGWTRAMQLLNDDAAMAEIIEQAPSLADDCVALSILHEVELVAALGANIETMRRGANAHPELPVALRHLTRLVRSRSNAAPTNDNVPTSGFAYSLEALSEDEDADDEETDDAERNPITQEQLAAALQAATEAVSTPPGRGGGSQDSLLRLLPTAGGSSRANEPATESSTPTGSGSSRGLITAEMFSEAITDAINRSGTTRSNSMGTPMEQSTAASSSQSPVSRDEDFTTQLNHMHELGLLDDAMNIRALLACGGDVTVAVNLLFSGALRDD